jgi:hypothetical protein
LIVLGYVLRIIRNVYDGASPVLPEWREVGDMLAKGFMAFLGILVWTLPVILLACCMGLTLAALGGAGGDSESMSTMASLISICMSCVIIILGIVISLFVYSPLTNFALNNQINTFWDFGGAWRFIQMNSGPYFIAFLLALVAQIIAGIIGGIACGIGLIFTSFWAMLVMGHLFGQVARANMTPTDSGMLPPAPPPSDEPPSILQGPIEPAGAA